MGWWQRAPRGDGLVAVVPSEDGVHLVAVSRSRGQAPQVSFCGSSRDGSRGLRQLADKAGISAYPVSVLLDEGAYQLLLVEAPDVRPEELRAAVRWRIKDLLDFHLDDAVIDVFEIPDQRHVNRHRMMYVVAARMRDLNERVQLAEDAGLSLEIVDIPEMALRNIATLLPEEAQGVAMLHLDKHSGVVAISRDGTLYLARRFEHGIGGQGEAASRAHLDAVLLEVQRSLDYYDSHFPHGPVSAVALTPSAAATPLASYLPGQLEVPVLTPALQDLIRFVQPPESFAPADILALGAALRQEAKVL